MNSKDANTNASTVPSRSKLSIIERYREYLPVSEKTCVVSLQEGDTPLIRAHNLEKHLGELRPVLLRRMAEDTTLIAASWAMTLLWRSSSIRRSFSLSL